jgi:hypothetical protein
VTLDPQVQHLIDSGVITPEQARAAADAAPAANEVAGFTVCLNTGCERYQESKPTRFVRHIVFHKAQGLPITESSTSHLCAVDDADLLCGSCRGPVAIQESAPPKYAKMLVV